MAAVTPFPDHWQELAAKLKAAHQGGIPVSRPDLSRLTQIRRYAPEDLTITVEAGLPFGQMQAELRRHGQWLPLDPPGADALTIARILDENLSGPRRYGYGTIREHLIGLRVALADGRIIRSGGEVVKNVAGYDLMKLFVGAQGSLGVIVEAAFKLRPLPARETCLAQSFSSWDEAGAAIDRVLASAITPVAFDLHNLGCSPGIVARLVLSLAGTEEEVDWQVAEARSLGLTEPSSLDHATALLAEPGPLPWQLSVLPSRLIEKLRGLGAGPFVARAGNGVIHCRRPAATDAPPASPSTLMQRIKATFDPAGILPPAPVA